MWVCRGRESFAPQARPRLFVLSVRPWAGAGGNFSGPGPPSHPALGGCLKAIQQGLLNRDLKISRDKARKGAHSRWGREMQRRCGNKIFWEMISFTGSFDPDFLRKALEKRNGGAGQPAANADAKAAKTRAHEARSRFRLGKKYSRLFTKAGEGALRPWQRELADKFDNGELLKACNAATREHGHGRLRTIVAFPRQRPQDPPNRPPKNLPKTLQIGPKTLQLPTATPVHPREGVLGGTREGIILYLGMTDMGPICGADLAGLGSVVRGSGANSVRRS